ncbi:hypothetical protein RIVM261_002130 [Rivularia sp. IAM M-261]|nr:hypothetical protein RIVM261_002130 [Rivularia sp. IAM M-261]
MTLTLNLPTDIEKYLMQEAEQKGLSTEAYTLQLLTEYIASKAKQAKAINVLQSWIDDANFQEQQETAEYLINALDENRLSKRKLFPSEMKGITW